MWQAALHGRNFTREKRFWLTYNYVLFKFVNWFFLTMGDPAHTLTHMTQGHRASPSSVRSETVFLILHEQHLAQRPVFWFCLRPACLPSLHWCLRPTPWLFSPAFHSDAEARALRGQACDTSRAFIVAGCAGRSPFLQEVPWPRCVERIHTVLYCIFVGQEWLPRPLSPPGA